MNKGTVRVLQMLSLFSQKPCWGVTEVSRAMDCSKNSAFQALNTLVLEGYLVREPKGSRYQLGHQSLKFIGDGQALDIRALCRPFLVRLHELTNESAFLSILVGRYHVCIDSYQPAGSTVGYTPLSQPLPLHAGTGSRLLLACLKDEEIERYLSLVTPLERFTPTTITDVDELWEEIRLVRRQGYARGYEDFSTGSTYLSFAVMAAGDRPLAAITIGGPIQRFTREIAESFIPAIRQIMDELNKQSRMFPAAPLIRF